VLSVHFTPCALFVAGVLALVRAGSFSGRSNWSAVWPRDPETAFGALAGITAAASVLGLLLRPFQVRAVRVLEGYWDRWPVTASLAGLLARMQRRRWQALRRRADGAAETDTARRIRDDARRRLAAHPPAEALLPTALGNALRAGELSAGERYGLTTLASWPRIYPQVTGRLADALGAARDALDTAVNLSWSFLALTAAATVALSDEPSQWWLCGTGLVLAAVAYKGAVIAAQSYSGLMHVVYDLHRFDLAASLHHPLPDDREAELELFARISDLVTGRVRADARYDHDPRRSGG
jgi:hypothetical protein